jgi:hypothetical protein
MLTYADVCRQVLSRDCVDAWCSDLLAQCVQALLARAGEHTLAYVSIRQHTPAYTPAYASIRALLARAGEHTPAYVSIRQHTPAYMPAYASIRQHTTAYDSIRQHTSALIEEA